MYPLDIPSVLWHCWLGGRKGIRPVKIWMVGCCAGVVICLERGAHLHIAQLMPLPLTVSCFSKIQIGFTFLALAHPGSPGQRAVKQVCMCIHSICAACFVVLWPHCAVDLLMNRWQGFLMSVDHYFSSSTKTFLFQSAYGHRETDWWLFRDAASVFSRGARQMTLLLLYIAHELCYDYVL